MWWPCFALVYCGTEVDEWLADLARSPRFLPSCSTLSRSLRQSLLSAGSIHEDSVLACQKDQRSKKSWTNLKYKSKMLKSLCSIQKIFNALRRTSWRLGWKAEIQKRDWDRSQLSYVNLSNANRNFHSNPNHNRKQTILGFRPFWVY